MTLNQSLLGDGLSGWAIAALLASIAVLLSRLASPPPLSGFPLVGQHYGSRNKRIEAFLYRPVELYAEGYRRFKDQIYRLTMPDGDHLIVPTRYLDELRQRSDEEIDVLKSFQDIFANDYIKLFPPRDQTELANSLIKVELNRNLARLTPRLSKEVDQAVNEELHLINEDWTPLPIFPQLLRIVAVVSGNLLVGPEYCRHDVYLASAIDFSTDMMAGAQEIKRWPRWFRPFVLPLGLAPAVTRARGHRRRMKEFLAPLVSERRRRLVHQDGKPVPEDVLQWMVEKTTKHGITDITDLVDMKLMLTLASIHTTSLSVTGMLYDIAIRPEVAQDIRKEIKSVLNETDGVMTSQALFNMKLLDSFMRESQRFTPPFVDSFRRYVQKPITLQDGVHIPAGTFIETPTLPVLHDASYYPDPDIFDPYRFYKLRTQDDAHARAADPDKSLNHEQYQFVSVTKENTSFGYGKHACPGRFFAANEIKLILARILLNFEVRFPPDVKERYPNFYLGSVIGPDPTGIVEFRQIQA